MKTIFNPHMTNATQRGVVKRIHSDTGQMSTIRFDSNTGTLILKSNSDHIGLHKFYFPILTKLKLYLQDEKNLAVGIFFSGLNASSLRVVFNLFKFLKTHIDDGVNIEIKWFVSAFDRQTYDTAKDIKQLYEVDLEVILSGS